MTYEKLIKEQEKAINIINEVLKIQRDLIKSLKKQIRYTKFKEVKKEK